MKVYLCPVQKLYTRILELIVLCSLLLAATYGYYGVLCGHCSFALVSNLSSPLHMIVEQRWVTLCITSNYTSLAGPDSSAAHLCALVCSHNNRLTCTPPPGFSMASTGYSLKGLNYSMASTPSLDVRLPIKIQLHVSHFLYSTNLVQPV